LNIAFKVGTRTHTWAKERQIVDEHPNSHSYIKSQCIQVYKNTAPPSSQWFSPLEGMKRLSRERLGPVMGGMEKGLSESVTRTHTRIRKKEEFEKLES